MDFELGQKPDYLDLECWAGRLMLGQPLESVRQYMETLLRIPKVSFDSISPIVLCEPIGDKQILFPYRENGKKLIFAISARSPREDTWHLHTVAPYFLPEREEGNGSRDRYRSTLTAWLQLPPIGEGFVEAVKYLCEMAGKERYYLPTQYMCESAQFLVNTYQAQKDQPDIFSTDISRYHFANVIRNYAGSRGGIDLLSVPLYSNDKSGDKLRPLLRYHAVQIGRSLVWAPIVLQFVPNAEEIVNECENQPNYGELLSCLKRNFIPSPFIHEELNGNLWQLDISVLGREREMSFWGTRKRDGAIVVFPRNTSRHQEVATESKPPELENLYIGWSKFFKYAEAQIKGQRDGAWKDFIQWMSSDGWKDEPPAAFWVLLGLARAFRYYCWMQSYWKQPSSDDGPPPPLADTEGWVKFTVAMQQVAQAEDEISFQWLKDSFLGVETRVSPPPISRPKVEVQVKQPSGVLEALHEAVEILGSILPFSPLNIRIVLEGETRVIWLPAPPGKPEDLDTRIGREQIPITRVIEFMVFNEKGVARFRSSTGKLVINLTKTSAREEA